MSIEFVKAHLNYPYKEYRAEWYSVNCLSKERGTNHNVTSRVIYLKNPESKKSSALALHNLAASYFGQGDRTCIRCDLNMNINTINIQKYILTIPTGKHNWMLWLLQILYLSHSTPQCVAYYPQTEFTI